MSLETVFRDFVNDETPLKLVDNTGSYDKLDFTLVGRSTSFHVETKEKRQPYSMKNWPGINIPEQHLFILDDLSARKILEAGPNAGLIVYANDTFFFFTVLDLFLMPKVRFNRPVNYERQHEVLKGKWGIDLRNGLPCASLSVVLDAITDYLRQKPFLFTATEAQGNYPGEPLPMMGTVRVADHRDIDFPNTR